MAYAVHYRFKWRSAKDNVYKIEILENNYSGSVVQRPLGGAPQLRRNKNGNICGTSLEFQAQALVDGELASLYSVSATAYRVDLYQNSTRIWQGFITPELYSEPYIAPPYNVKVTATDNLGELKLSDYVGQGLDTVANQLSYILGKTGLSFSTHWLSAMHPSSATSVTAANMPSSTRINLNHMEGKSCHDVLQALLATFNATIVQYGCAWCIVRETDLEALRSGATITAPDGTTFSIGDFGSMASEVWWPVGYLSQTVVPAKKEKVIKAPNNWIGNLLPKTATSSTRATYYEPTDGDSPYYELVPYSSGSYSAASIAFWSGFSEFVPVKDLTLSLLIQTFGTLAGHAYGKKCAAVTVKVVGSDGSSYINCWLNSEGDLVSSSSEALALYGVGQDAPEQHNLVIPVASQMSAMGYTKIYQIQVTIASTDAEDSITRMRLYDWTCNIAEQNQGYQVTCILNNGARGDAEQTELAAADNTNKNLESVFVTNGFKYTAALGGASIAEWASSNISSMALLEFLARDYSLGIAVPRLRMEGALSIPQSVGLPLLFRGGGLIYCPETFDWNLLDDAINVSMLSLPAASVLVTSVTRTAEGSQGMVVSSGGSAPASGGGGGGTGTVTSVGLTMPAQFDVSGSPVTGAGTFAVTLKNTYDIPTASLCQKWSAAYDNMHTHSNKSVLDGITSTKVSNWDTAYSDHHTHSNKSTLDGISSSDVSSWNGAVTTANNAYAAAVTNKISDQSGISGSATGLVTGAAVYEYVGSHSSNDHVTGFSWTDGTSSGPTGSITQSESSAVSVPAIPAAASNKSGVVTTGAQTFAGNKTFNGNVVSGQKVSAAALAVPSSAPSGAYISTTEWYISIDTSAISGSVV